MTRSMNLKVLATVAVILAGRESLVAGAIDAVRADPPGGRDAYVMWVWEPRSSPVVVELGVSPESNEREHKAAGIPVVSDSEPAICVGGSGY
jgi:hypothetical protein